MAEVERMYWLTGDLVKRYNVPSSTLLYYCKFFDITPARGRNNYRRYTKAHVEKLDSIIGYVREGFHLKAIKDKLLKSI